MIPEDDRPAQWLSSYRTIEADIRRMEDVAAKLDAEVRQNYAPHLSYISDDVLTKLPDPCDAFIELVTFLEAHRTSQQATSDLVHFFRDATGGLAVAADEISRQYRGADAFASARVGDVERAFTGTSTAPGNSTGPGASTTSQTSTAPHTSVGGPSTDEQDPGPPSPPEASS